MDASDIIFNKLKKYSHPVYAVYQITVGMFSSPVYKIVPYEGTGLDLPSTFVGTGDGDLSGATYLLIRTGLPDKEYAEEWVEKQKAKESK